MSRKLLRIVVVLSIAVGFAAYAGAQASKIDSSAPSKDSGAVNSKIDDSAKSSSPGTNSVASPSDAQPSGDEGAAATGTDTAPATTGTSSPAAGSANAQNTSAPHFSQREPRYKLTRNDVVNITFPFTPEYNQVVTVQPDGFINLKQLPDMKVEGMNTSELTAALTTAYSKQLHDPVITITLQTFVAPYFIANGEVKNPGKFQLSGDTSVTQAIGIAGGFTSAAKHSEVYLFRRVSNEWVSAQKIDVKHMLASANLAEDQHVEAGDMIFVPKNKIAKLISVQPLIPYNLFRLNFGTF